MEEWSRGGGWVGETNIYSFLPLSSYGELSSPQVEKIPPFHQIHKLLCKEWAELGRISTKGLVYACNVLKQLAIISTVMTGLCL